MEWILRRPLAVFGIFMMAGIIVAGLSGSFLVAVSSLMLLSACLYALYNKFKGKPVIFIGILLFYAIGAFEFLCLERINTGRFADYESEIVTVRGYVDSEPEVKEAKVSYVIKVEEFRTSGDISEGKGKILLSTVKNEKTSLYEYGREVTFTGQLKLPRGLRNPGGFDYKRYLSQKGVSGVVFVLNENILPGNGRKASFLIDAGRTLRMGIVGVIEKSLPRQQAGLLNGMLIGYTEGLTQEVTNAFSDAGLTHIMAVSGANVAFIMLPLVFIFKKLRIGHTAANAFIIGFLTVFVFITGFQPSVLRAVVMAVIILSGRMMKREADIYTTISFAAVLLLLYSPYMLFNIGFQLSFAATLSLVMLFKNIKKLIQRRFIPGKVADVLAATLAAQIGVLPITVFYFNKVSIISILSNLLVVPLLEIITILGMLMAVLGQFSILFSQLVGYVNCVLLSFVLYVSKISTSLPFSTLKMITPSIPAVVFYYLAVWFLLWYKPAKNLRIKLRYIAAALATTVAIGSIGLLVPGRLEVTFLDVGEGDCALIRTHTGKTILLDGGGSIKLKSGPGVGEMVVIPFLLDKGITRLDLVIASHGHGDHIQGLLPVLEEFRVNNLVIPSLKDEKEFTALLQAADGRGVKVTRCAKGDIIRLDDKTSFDVLHPLKDFSPDNTSLNNTSFVLKLHYGQTDVLFLGDAEKEVEAMLLESKTDLSADVIKIAHHGSETSSTQAFIDNIKPKAAVISVGTNNFGHPSPSVVEMLENGGMHLFRTDEYGAVILTSTGKGIRMAGTVTGSGKGKK